MLSKLLIATGNRGKLKEFKKVLAGVCMVYSPRELSLLPKEVVEGGDYRENAILKARAYSDQFKEFIAGEDSGLEVDALDGKPGVFSARYGGENLPHTEKCSMLLNELRSVPLYDRTARFRATIALLDGNEVKVFEGTMEGWIAFSYEGAEGFGYDPIFIPQGFSKTNAQLGMKIKNQISHRAKALRKLAEYLKTR